MISKQHTTTRSIWVLKILAIAFVAFLFAPAAFAQSGDHDAHHQTADKPINAMCPVGKESIVPSAGTVQYKGHTIGLCCPGCGKAFLAWPEEKRDEFVRLAMIGKEPGQEAHGEQPATTQPDDGKGEPYLLETCPVSGQKLGSMGDPIVKAIDGREVRFCCAGCVGKFEADKDKYFAEIDKEMVERQLPYYPLDTCVVTGDPLVEDGEDIAVNHIYMNRLMRFCCKMCVKEFGENPQKFLEKLNKAVAEEQREHYPLDTCLVSGQKLGSMGEPVEKVYGNRLVKFCCAGCIKKFEENPTAFVQQLDTAWKEHGHMPGVGAAHHDADHDRDHKVGDHDHHGHSDGDGDHDDHDNHHHDG